MDLVSKETYYILQLIDEDHVPPNRGVKWVGGIKNLGIKTPLFEKFFNLQGVVTLKKSRKSQKTLFFKIPVKS
jgi:hypothetical protein